MPLAAAVAGAAVIGGAVSVSANNKAAKAARDAAAKSNAIQQGVYTESKANLAPFVGAGSSAATSINALLGLGGDKAAAGAAFDAYQGSTGYQARLQEGQKQVTAALGGRGLLDSGAAQKSLLKYGQTFASGEFGNYLGALQGQQAVGLSAASTQANLGQNYANAVSANTTNAANVQANSYLANGAAINGALGGVLSAYSYAQGLGSSYGSGGAVLTGATRNQTSLARGGSGGFGY